MNGSGVKDIRKQIRNVVQDLLPEIMRMEIYKEIASEMRKDIATRLEVIETMVKNSLEKMDQRSMDVENYMINQLHSQLVKNHEAPPVPEETNLSI
jgi:hypothetical protein